MGQAARKQVRDFEAFRAQQAARRGLDSPSGEIAAGARESPRVDLETLSGRLVEVSARGASAVLSLAVDLVRQAQEAAEPVAWLSVGTSSFYPPDLAASGIDLAALAVVRVANPIKAADAAVRLGRSGAFGLLICDPDSGVQVPTGALTRLVGLAQKHELAVVFLTTKAASQPSLQSLISLRLEALRSGPVGRGATRGVRANFEAIKDKRRGPGWTDARLLLPPPGWSPAAG